MDIGTYKSVDAEIWFGDRFWGDTKTLGDFDPLKNCEK